MKNWLITWLLLIILYLATRLIVQYLAAGFPDWSARFWLEVLTVSSFQALILVLISRVLPGLLKRGL